MDALQDKYEYLSRSESDINEHLETLCSLARGADVVVELGTRSGVSTIGLLAAQPNRLICIDINENAPLAEEYTHLKGHTELIFICTDDLSTTIPECDVLFIDTYHTYNQLRQELALHAEKAKKYIAFHDTVTFGRVGEDRYEKGLLHAIEEYMKENPQWEIKQHYTNNNGLLVLQKRLRKKNIKSKHE